MRTAISLPILVTLIVLVAAGGGILTPVAATNPLATLACLVAGALLVCPPFGCVALGLFRRLYRVSPGRFRLGLFMVGLLINAIVALVVFHGVPRLDDGVAALFQARLLARGAATIPLPPAPGFYEVFGVLSVREHLAHMCGMYPPGWPALLVPGIWLKAPWLLNPLLGALLALTVCALGREWFDERVARTAGILTVLSPMAATLAGTHLSHTATALCLTACLLFARRMLHQRTAWYGLLAGLCWGVAFLCRPLTSLVVGAIVGVGLLLEFRAFLRAWRGALIALAVAALAVGVLLLFQRATTGDALTPGHKLGMAERGKFGFSRLDSVRTHTPAIGLQNTRMRIAATSAMLLGWPISAMLIIGYPFLRRRTTLRHVLLLAPCVALLLTYLPYWYYEMYFPARYLFASVPLLLILAAHGATLLADDASRLRPRWRDTIRALIAAGPVFLLALLAPRHFSSFSSAFGDVEEVLPRVVVDYSITNAVVFMDVTGEAPAEPDPRNDYYATGFMRNNLTFDGDVVYARNSRERNVEMLPVFPNRAFYVYRYDRGSNKAMLWRLVAENGAFRGEPVTPRTRDLEEAHPAQ
jgi:hypothetical protein